MLDLERAFRDHNQAVYRYCRSRLRNPVDAEDAVQEVFARAAQKQQDLDEDVLPWLITVARHICLDEQRRMSQLGARSVGDDEDLARLVDDSATGNPEGTTIGRIRVGEMLEVLTPAEQLAVRETWIHGHTEAGAANKLGVTRGTSSRLITRARKRLITYLANQGAAIGGIVLGGRLWLRGHWPYRSQPAEQGLTAAVRLAMVGAVCAVVVSTGAAPAGQAGAASSGGHPTDDSEPAGYVAGGTGLLASPATGGGSLVGPSALKTPTPGGKTTVLSLIDPNHHASPQQVAASDTQASPNYPQDHTVLIAGTDTSCSAGQCYTLIESNDAGASWQQLAASGFASTSLLLPSDFGAGHFYGYGPSGLQSTTDGGKSFQPAGPNLRGYPSLMTDATGTHVLVSNAAGIFEYQAAGAASPLYAFPPGEEAAGSALQFNRSAGGLLQPVIDISNPLAPSEHVLSCQTVCVGIASFGWSGTAKWATLPSPGPDAVIALWSTLGSAVSKDGGASFQALGVPTGTQAWGMAMTLVGTTVRLGTIVGATGAARADRAEYSDDYGASWKPAAPSTAVAGAKFEMLAAAGASNLIAPATTSNLAAPFLFACSQDGGASWSSC